MERLNIKQARDVGLWRVNLEYVKQKLKETLENEREKKTALQAHIEEAERMIDVVTGEDYIEKLKGTPGADWVHRGTC